MKKLDYKSVGVTYTDDCPDKERHINAIVLPIMVSSFMGDLSEHKEKCKVCGNLMWSVGDMESIEKIGEVLKDKQFDGLKEKEVKNE